MKYKFRLSYKNGYKYIPINLNEIDFLTDFSKTEIKTIDNFTTHFENYEDMINYLRHNNLIPSNIDRLYLTFDVKQDNKINEQLYAYNKTLFFKKDIERLKFSYIYKYFKDKFKDGAFIEKIVNHYEKKYIHKNFTTLKVLARAIKVGNIYSLESSDLALYYQELEKFLDFIFRKKTKKGVETNYKNVRDFLCFIGGEEPIKVRTNQVCEPTNINTVNSEETKDDFVEPFNISLEEYTRFNESLVNDVEDFEPFRDGNDYIAPITREEIIESLNDYARKHTLRRDNGEYE